MSSVKLKSVLEGASFVPVDGYAALFQDAPPPTEEDLRRIEQAECAAADAARARFSSSEVDDEDQLAPEDRLTRAG